MRVIAAFLVNTLCNFAIGLLVARFLGPEEFGRFALALSVGLALQTSLFEWIRQSAIRFYSARSRLDEPGLRATLDVSFAGLAAAAMAVVAGAMLVGVDLPMSNALIGLALAASITNGLFDYNTAMVRARFDDALYGKLILTKNLVAVVATAGGAFLFHSATMALVGVCVSMAGSLLTFRSALADPGVAPALARRATARSCVTYAAPIVVANLLYLFIPLANRALMARWYGFAETGQFSLAFDIGTRVVASIGSTLDVLLFQLAVRADEHHGAEHGREQVARNMAIVFAILAPACVGVWLTLPSIERLVVPEQFRGPFQFYFGLVLPGHFASGLLWYAINPVFQIAKRTLPMIIGALVACTANLLLVAALPQVASSLAIAQSGAMIAGLLTLIVASMFARARFPAARDILVVVVATGVMLLTLLPWRAASPGVLTLAGQAIVGVVIYTAFIAVFDVAGLRGVGLEAIGALRARLARRRLATEPAADVKKAGEA